MLIGYARISANENNLDLQLDSLKKAGCEKIFKEEVNGVKSERLELQKAVKYLKEGDTLVIWRLDRLGKSVEHLIMVVNDLSERNIGFYSLKEDINTTTSAGKLFLNLFKILVEFQKDIATERTNAARVAARERGRLGGRPQIMNKKMKKKAVNLYNDKNNSIDDICKTLGVSRSTFYRALRELKKMKGSDMSELI